MSQLSRSSQKSLENQLGNMSSDAPLVMHRHSCSISPLAEMCISTTTRGRPRSYFVLLEAIVNGAFDFGLEFAQAAASQS